jgi:hypothetical protein
MIEGEVLFKVKLTGAMTTGLPAGVAGQTPRLF